MCLFFQNDFTEWGMYSTELYTTVAVNIIQSHDPSKPLYLYLPHQAVHSANSIQPLQAPEKLINKFKNIEDERRRIYAAMVTALDDSVGKVKRNFINLDCGLSYSSQSRQRTDFNVMSQSGSRVWMGGYKYQLSVKIMAICQLSVKF